MNHLEEIAGLMRNLVAQNATIIDQLADLPAAIAAASQRGSVLSRKDRQALPVLLKAVYAVKGREIFAARELVETKDAALKKTLVRVLGPLTKGSARRLGGLFGRVAGVEVGDLRFVRLGDARNSALWKVERVSELTTVSLPHSDIRSCA